MQLVGSSHRGAAGRIAALVVASLIAVVVFALAAVPVFAGATFGLYQTWDSTGPNAGTGGPHQNYQVSTNKCSVCHAVHYAATTTSTAGVFGPAATGENTQMLLRSSVADSCTYCHISTNVGGLQIYGGITSQYTNDDVYGHNGTYTATCGDCHSVHGADTFGGGLARKILKRGGAPANTNGNVQTSAASAYAPLNGGDVFNGSGDKEAQVSAFCTRCHKVWTNASETTITADGFTASGGTVTNYTNRQYKAHPLKQAGATFSAMGTTFGGRVAWKDSTYCRSCHAAGVTDQAGVYTGVVLASFPHYTPARARFLTSGYGSADVSATALGAGNAVNDPTQDGVCLRCHTNGSASGNATAGVGVNF